MKLPMSRPQRSGIPFGDRKEELPGYESLRMSWMVTLFFLLLSNMMQAQELIPNDPVQTKKIVTDLKRQYAPYLQSLPEKIHTRNKEFLTPGRWCSKYEFNNAIGENSPGRPAWHIPELNDASWDIVSLPEWRYGVLERMVPSSSILWYRTKFSAELPGNGDRIFLVFEGVDWEAEVWLNGQKLGRHSVYFEPFRFDVTGIIDEYNTLAVRVTDGPQFGEPAAYWSLYPVPYAEETIYKRDRDESLIGLQNGDTHVGSGYGIFREVYLERTGKNIIEDLFVRGYPERGEAKLKILLNSAVDGSYTLDLKIIPENFKGESYGEHLRIDIKQGDSEYDVEIDIPDAMKWTPNTPYLYRCRASLIGADGIFDTKDVLFGYRTFEIAGKSDSRKGYQTGTFLLNGNPVYLRGTNIQGLNALWLWGQHDKLFEVLMMLKAAHFNAVRSCQHVMFPEVRELLDRTGIMSEQDVGCRFPRRGEQSWDELEKAAESLTKICYNNPGVVLISYANETDFNPDKLVRSSLSIDPERIIKPISGHAYAGSEWPGKDEINYELKESLHENVIEDVHPYWGWYEYVGEIWNFCKPLEPGRMITIGEYGAEALDSYETMERYPVHWGSTPGKETDTLWGHVQLQKNDSKQWIGYRGSNPENLVQYIEASQNYQADVCGELSKGWRLSPRRVSGYFQFHFIDVLPANWPKSIVSNDLMPKQAYYEMAQVNQPVAPLPVISENGSSLELWVANDLPETFKEVQLAWKIKYDMGNLAGDQTMNIPASGAVVAKELDLSSIPGSSERITISLKLKDPEGITIGQYEREFFLLAWRTRSNGSNKK